jgi:hypothetical protein
MAFILGLVAGILVLGMLLVTWPESFRGTDKLLNSGKYRIDTTVTTTMSGGDTTRTVRYKFVRR